MRKYSLLLTIALILLMQGCSQKEALTLPIKEIKNIDEINQKVNVYINKKYGEDVREKLLQNIHYDLEYINTITKRYIFIKFKNSFIFCGSGGCSAKMLEYAENKIGEIESMTLIRSSIYLIHDNSESSFSQIVVPVTFMDGPNYSTYYNVYEPFSDGETHDIYPSMQGYKELQRVLKTRKESIKLFEEE